MNFLDFIKISNRWANHAQAEVYYSKCYWRRVQGKRIQVIQISFVNTKANQLTKRRHKAIFADTFSTHRSTLFFPGFC